jgi:hypothetical protein
MENQENVVEAQVAETGAAVEAQVAETATENTPAAVVAKVPRVTKKSQAFVIFYRELQRRADGHYKSNKDFRITTCYMMVDELGVSIASAATMYNAAKIEVEAKDPNVGLGRDPKKVKPVKAEGSKRSRPAVAAAETAPATETAAAAESDPALDTSALDTPAETEVAQTPAEAA